MKIIALFSIKPYKFIKRICICRFIEKLCKIYNVGFLLIMFSSGLSLASCILAGKLVRSMHIFEFSIIFNVTDGLDHCLSVRVFTFLRYYGFFSDWYGFGDQG